MLCNVREFRATDIAELTGLCPMLLCDDMGTAWAFSMEKRFTVVMRKGRVHLGSDGTKRLEYMIPAVFKSAVHVLAQLFPSYCAGSSDHIGIDHMGFHLVVSEDALITITPMIGII